MNQLIPVERIESKILVIREQKVMLDRDLAELYGVGTKVLNQAVRRNIKRFPEDFMFKLTKEERDELVTICDRLERLKHSSSFPYAFTEQGVAMLSSVLNSEKAILVNIQIMRTFTKIKKMLASHEELKKKVEDMEARYETQFKIVFDAIKALLEPPVKKTKPIGFLRENDE